MPLVYTVYTCLILELLSQTAWERTVIHAVHYVSEIHITSKIMKLVGCNVCLSLVEKFRK